MYGRQRYLATRGMPPFKLTPANSSEPANRQAAAQTVTSSIVPAQTELNPAKIDKSVLTISEPKRLRDKAHLKFMASQPCPICGRQPCDPHHLRFAQPRAIGLKVSDEFTVPLCRGHHRQLHQAGDEVAWCRSSISSRWRLPKSFGTRPIQGLALADNKQQASSDTVKAPTKG